MKKIARSAVFLCAITVFSSHILAQQLYRIVGPDGRVTFSDKPPPPTANANVTTGRSGASADSAGSGSALPFELRNVAQKFPVTLYTAKDCSPCDAGRNMLRNRGIPFAERTVESNEDIEALKRLAGVNSLPVATVGGQLMKGFSDTEWKQFLDAAGYPASSQLPNGYRQPAPSPLVARAAATPAPAASAAAPAPAPTPTRVPAADPASTQSNPTGIRF